MMHRSQPPLYFNEGFTRLYTSTEWIRTSLIILSDSSCLFDFIANKLYSTTLCFPFIVFNMLDNIRNVFKFMYLYVERMGDFFLSSVIDEGSRYDVWQHSNLKNIPLLFLWTASVLHANRLLNILVAPNSNTQCVTYSLPSAKKRGEPTNKGKFYTNWENTEKERIKCK